MHPTFASYHFRRRVLGPSSQSRLSDKYLSDTGGDFSFSAFR